MLFHGRLGKAQITDVKECITGCQAAVKDLYEKLSTRIVARMANNFKEMHARVKETQEDAKQRDAKQLSDEMRQWLKPYNTSTNHKAARDTHVKGSGSWCPEDERFQKWLNEPGTTLWISAGREHPLDCLVRTFYYMRDHTDPWGSTCGCAYFYLDARKSGGAPQEFETLLRTVLVQLCSNQANIPAVLKHLYGVDRNDHPEPTLSQIRTVEEVVDEVYILIDAVEESNSQGELLDWMNSLQSTTLRLHLLVTSRPERIIEERMAKSRHARISLTSDVLDNDIKAYVNEHVNASTDLKLLMTEEMKKKLRVKGDGM
ncbi:hypothetical protein PAXRUDRAFT_11271 [Paxillus rubicundulus Ve08.2h10]|uniref:Unplaced genomic scaffold scaffold_203, whole genome shotgun sequence n=1 Tax=Paxillus rubicundulus Ve08.2h10 TaxID=930991 RepID=A0A0D0E3W0_9AGAM|nr:hypothetical protein PAXRUDRAFT_11271 [Paxillus rubicundulus Ve08.2h10]